MRNFPQKGSFYFLQGEVASPSLNPHSFLVQAWDRQWRMVWLVDFFSIREQESYNFDSSNRDNAHSLYDLFLAMGSFMCA